MATETSSATLQASGSYLYSYTVTVSALSTSSASQFDLSLVGAVDPNSIISPNNFFAFYSPGDPFISFTAFDNGTATNGISPGSSGTFSFTSLFAPTMGVYQTSGFDSTTSTPVSASGSAIIPGVNVPEPSSLVLSSLAICGALGLFARSRRQSSILLS